jgi:hypothetical protein
VAVGIGVSVGVVVILIAVLVGMILERNNATRMAFKRSQSGWSVSSRSE